MAGAAGARRGLADPPDAWIAAASGTAAGAQSATACRASSANDSQGGTADEKATDPLRRARRARDPAFAADDPIAVRQALMDSNGAAAAVAGGDA